MRGKKRFDAFLTNVWTSQSDCVIDSLIRDTECNGRKQKNVELETSVCPLKQAMPRLFLGVFIGRDLFIESQSITQNITMRRNYDGSVRWSEPEIKFLWTLNQAAFGSVLSYSDNKSNERFVIHLKIQILH